MNYQKLLNEGTNFLKTGNIVKPEFDCELLLSKALNKKREELSKSLEISNQRLNNDKFVENAKQELIDQEKQNVQNLNSQIESINSTLKSLDN